MSSLLMAFLIVLLVPLLTATWRMSLLGLALQGLLLGWMALRADEGLSPSGLLLLVDFVLVRGVLAPRYLYGILRSRNAAPRNDVIPANLFFWALAGTLVLLAFRGARALAHADAATTHLGVAATAVMLGFLVLATQDSVLSQIVGVLRIENGIALFELTARHHPPLLVEGGILLVFVVSILFLGGFLRRLHFAEPSADAGPSRPTL